jgi:histone H3/H4
MKQTALIIPRLSFSRVVRDIMMDCHPFLRIQSTALACLQEAVESVLIMWFEMGYLSIFIDP